MKISVGNGDGSEGEGLFVISDSSAGDEEYFNFYEELLKEF